MDMDSISTLSFPMNAFGGSKESSQFMAKAGLREQLEFRPNGYGIAMSPQFLGHPVFVMLEPNEVWSVLG